MAVKRTKLRRTAAGVRMRSRDRLIHLRETRLKQMGVTRFRYLTILPVLVALIMLTAWLRSPSVTQVHFRPNEANYDAPLAGLAVWADRYGQDVRLDAPLIYAEITWAELEIEPGRYDFEAFEEKYCLQEWWREGKKLILRFVMDQPGEPEHMDIPDWLYQEIGGAGNYYESSSGAGFSPDYSHLMLRERHRQAILALATRYDGHPGVAYIELGSLGRNGEWTVELDEEGITPLPMSNISREYAWHYTSSFQSTPMLMRRPYKETQLMQVGLYNPLLGNGEATWQWLDDIESGGYDRQIETDLMSMPDFYRCSPSGAHIAADVDLEALLKEDAEVLLRQIRESHLSYVVLEGDLSAISDQAIEQLNAMGGELGSRLWLRRAEWDNSVRSGARSKVLLRFRNDGIAPLAVNWPVALALFDGERMLALQRTEVSAVSLQPGDTDCQAYMDIPDSLKVGKYTLKLAILDAQTGEPAVRLSMDECDEETLWTTLGELNVFG